MYSKSSVPYFPAQVELARPRGGVGARIVHRDFVGDRRLVGAGELLDRVHLAGVRQAAPIEPEALVVAGRVHDERIAVPPPDRMPVIGGREVLRVRAPVHVDGAERVRTTDVEDVDALRLGQLDELDAVGRQELAGRARRLAAACAARARSSADVVHRFRPRLERHGLCTAQSGRGCRRPAATRPCPSSSAPPSSARPAALRGAGLAGPALALPVPTPPRTSCVPPPPWPTLSALPRPCPPPCPWAPCWASTPYVASSTAMTTLKMRPCERLHRLDIPRHLCAECLDSLPPKA